MEGDGAVSAWQGTRARLCAGKPPADSLQTQQLRPRLNSSSSLAPGAHPARPRRRRPPPRRPAGPRSPAAARPPPHALLHSRGRPPHAAPLRRQRRVWPAGAQTWRRARSAGTLPRLQPAAEAICPRLLFTQQPPLPAALPHTAPTLLLQANLVVSGLSLGAAAAPARLLRLAAAAPAQLNLVVGAGVSRALPALLLALLLPHWLVRGARTRQWAATPRRLAGRQPAGAGGRPARALLLPLAADGAGTTAPGQRRGGGVVPLKMRAARGHGGNECGRTDQSAGRDSLERPRAAQSFQHSGSLAHPMHTRSTKPAWRESCPGATRRRAAGGRAPAAPAAGAGSGLPARVVQVGAGDVWPAWHQWTG